MRDKKWFIFGKRNQEKVEQKRNREQLEKRQKIRKAILKNDTLILGNKEKLDSREEEIQKTKEKQILMICSKFPYYLGENKKEEPLEENTIHGEIGANLRELIEATIFETSDMDEEVLLDSIDQVIIEEMNRGMIKKEIDQKDFKTLRPKEILQFFSIEHRKIVEKMKNTEPVCIREDLKNYIEKYKQETIR